MSQIRHENNPARLDALERGQLTFRLACPHGHDRYYVSTGTCVRCASAIAAKKTAARRAARPVRAPKPVTRRSHHSAADNLRRAQQARDLAGDKQKAKARALMGLAHSMQGPEAVATSKRLDEAIRNGANYTRRSA